MASLNIVLLINGTALIRVYGATRAILFASCLGSSISTTVTPVARMRKGRRLDDIYILTIYDYKT